MDEELGVLINVESTDEGAAGLESTAGSADALQAALDTLATAIARVSGQMAELNGSMAELDASMEANTEATQANTSALAEHTGAADAAKDSNENWSKSFGGMLLPLGLATAAVVGIGIASIDMYSKYQTAMSVVQGLTGVSAGDMKKLNTQVLQMATALGTDPTQLANGLYYILSAGVQTKDAMGVLKVVTEASAAGMVDAKTDADALTTALNAYGQGANKAGIYQDYILTSIKDGKTTLQEYAGSLAQLAPTAHAVGISFQMATAAESALTTQGFTARKASTDLAFAMRYMDGETDTLAKTAKGLGVSFDENKFKSMNFIQQLQYLQKQTGGNTAEMMKLTGGAAGWLAAQALLTNKGGMVTQIFKDMGNASGMTATAFAIHEQTIGASFDHLKTSVTVAMIELGKALDPIVTTFMTRLTPAFQAFGNWVATHGQLAAHIFLALAAVLGGAFVVALGAVSVAFLMAQASALPFIAAGAVLVGVIALIAMNWKQISAALQPVLGLFRALGSLLSPIGAALKDELGSTLATLGQTIKANFLPAWQNIQAVFTDIKPLLIGVGALIGGVLVVAFGLLAGVLTGVVRGFGELLSGAIKFTGGMVQAVSGAVRLVASIVGGILAILGDIIHGNWSKIGTDAANMWNGIKSSVVSIVHGLWTAVQGLFQAAFGTINGLVGGFISGVVGFFQSLFDKIIGHSIIPDLVNGVISYFESLASRLEATALQMVTGLIATFLDMEAQVIAGVNAFINQAISFFESLPPRAVSAVSTMRSEVIGIMDALASDMLNAGAKLLSQLAAGIESHIPIVSGVVNKVAGLISRFFPRSPAKEGPLVGWQDAGGHLLQMYADSMKGATDTVQTAAHGAAQAVVGGMGYSGAGGMSGTNAILQEMLGVMRSGFGPGTGAGTPAGVPNPITNQWGGINISGANNQQIINLLNQLSQLQGLEQEMSRRGMVGGWALS